MVKQSSSKNFAVTLRRFRVQLGVSQSKLAQISGYDHSYMSRLENAQRFPKREAVLRLAASLELDVRSQDRLLIDAGFMPERIESFFVAVPEIVEVWEFLTSEDVPDSVKANLRELIAVALSLSRSTE